MIYLIAQIFYDLKSTMGKSESFIGIEIVPEKHLDVFGWCSISCRLIVEKYLSGPVWFASRAS